MIETFTHCAFCKTDTRLGIEIHCPLCHANYSKGTQHTCRVLDEVVAEGREPSTIEPRFKRAQIVFPNAASVGARDWSEVKPVEVPCGE